jgi:pyridoxal phosphate-dependent aminotransferase EpsN
VHAGATPVFVDSDAATWTMDPDLLHDVLQERRRANRLPRALVVVDLYGQCADYDAIVGLCHDLGVVVVEDAAEALGSTYRDRPAGTLGDIGVLSFNGNKIITTSGGGMVLAPDEDVTERVRYLATQARQPALHYEHTEVGYNYRLSNLLAALGRAQLARLPEIVRRRRQVNDLYRRKLAAHASVAFMPRPAWSGWNGWLTCVTFDRPDQRDAVMAALAADDIESRPLWKPMHAQPVYSSHEAWTSGVSDHLFACGLCLPSGSGLTDADVERVAGRVSSALQAGDQ